jgi:class 3 adenylate cyclase
LFWLPASSYPVDLLFDEPSFSHLATRLASFSRSIWFIPRGMSASGGDFQDNFTQGVQPGDINALLDDADVERITLVAPGPSGPWAIEYCRAHPERVAALVLINSFAHYIRERDYPIGIPRDALDRFVGLQAQRWGTGAGFGSLTASRTDDPQLVERWARMERLGQAPSEGAETMRLSVALDVREILPTLSMPTLILHRTWDPLIRVEAGRYLAENIAGSRYVELAGDEHLFFSGDVDAVADEVEDFITGGHQAPEGDVVTATIVFTDIVASTEQTSSLGHRRWLRVADDHDAMVRAALARFRGHEVKRTGDGFVATFDAATRAVRAATEIVKAANAMGIEVRAGVHTGEIEVRLGDVLGLPVNIAKRICDLAGASQVLVSESVKSLIEDAGFALADAGVHQLKGVPGERRIFSVTA